MNQSPAHPSELTYCPVCQTERELMVIEDELFDADGEEMIALEFNCNHSTMIYADRYQELTS